MIPGVTIFEFADQTGLTLDEAADALCSARQIPVEELCMAWGFPPARAAQLAVRNLSLNAFVSDKQRKWFFANKHERKMTLFHGTEADFVSFDPGKKGTATDEGFLGSGFYFSTDPSVARSSSRRVTADVTVNNPLMLKMPDWTADKNALANTAIGTTGLKGEELTAALKSRGHDAVSLDYSPLGYKHTEWVVFDPGQIKVKENTTQNAFASAASRRWYFANLDKQKAAGKGDRGSPSTAVSYAKVDLQFAEGVTIEKIQQDFFGGQKINKRDLCALACSNGEGRVRVRLSTDGQNLRLLADSPDHETSRAIPKGGKIVHNEAFFAEKTGTGLGTRLLANQVDAAARLGVDRIMTMAERLDSDDPGSAMVGYYTWPRLGYDAPLNGRLQELLGAAAKPHGLTQAEIDRMGTLQDLFRTKGGRDLWKEAGLGMPMAFDPKPGSRSREILDAYVEAKFGGQTQNAFASAAQRKWWFANLGKKQQAQSGGSRYTLEQFARLNALGDQNLTAAREQVTPPIDRAILAMQARSRREDKRLEKVRTAVLRKEQLAEQKWEEHHQATADLMEADIDYQAILKKANQAYERAAASGDPNHFDYDNYAIYTKDAEAFIKDRLRPLAEKVDKLYARADKATKEVRKKAWAEIAKNTAEQGEPLGDLGSIVRNVEGGHPYESYAEAKPVLGTWLRNSYRYSLPPVDVEAIPPDQKQRSYHVSGVGREGTEKSVIAMANYAGAPTFAHEFGHTVETHPEVSRMARAFLAHRTQGAGYKKLHEQLPDHDHDPNEVGSDDKFAAAFGAERAWYVGKYYPGGSTEIVSMGLEQLYRDPIRFAREDPEYFKFMLGILDRSMLDAKDGEPQ